MEESLDPYFQSLEAEPALIACAGDDGEVSEEVTGQPKEDVERPESLGERNHCVEMIGKQSLEGCPARQTSRFSMMLDLLLFRATMLAKY